MIISENQKFLKVMESHNFVIAHHQITTYRSLMVSKRFELLNMMGSDDTQRDWEIIRHRGEEKSDKKISGL